MNTESTSDFQTKDSNVFECKHCGEEFRCKNKFHTGNGFLRDVGEWMRKHECDYTKTKPVRNHITIMKIKKIELMKLLALAGVNKQTSTDDSHWEIGKDYLIRTVTHALCGRLVKAGDKELVLEDAAWVADLGRFNKVWQTSGEDAFREVEMFAPRAPIIVGRGAIIDGAQLGNGLPTKTK